MILYHGSTVVVEQPRVDLNRTPTIDFGMGFYMTTSYEQAERGARTKMLRSKVDAGYVSIYEFDFESAKQNCIIHIFDQADEKWLDFVTKNRANRMGLCVKSAKDMNIGPIADDNVIETIKLFEHGVFTKDETIRRLKTEQLKDQWVAHSVNVLKYLNFIGYDAVKG